MIKILIIETSNISVNTSIAHVRNACVLSTYLNKTHTCDIIDLSYIHTECVVQYDIILFSYATGRVDFTEIDKLIISQPKSRIGWITNEFELFANDYIKKRMTFMINNFDYRGIKKAHTYNELLTTNLNTLIMKEPNSKTEKKYDMCYYGTYRKYRKPYFQKYFKNDVVVSTSKKNWKKFIDDEVLCNVTEKFSWIDGRETLNLFRTTLYIEDTKTHEWFNHMANRFFESLYCNTAVFFDVTCINTIAKDKYVIDDYFIVNSYEEYEYKSKNLDIDKLDKFLVINSKIALEEKRKTLKDIESFLCNLVNN